MPAENPSHLVDRVTAALTSVDTPMAKLIIEATESNGAVLRGVIDRVLGSEGEVAPMTGQEADAMTVFCSATAALREDDPLGAEVRTLLKECNFRMHGLNIDVVYRHPPAPVPPHLARRMLKAGVLPSIRGTRPRTDGPEGKNG